MNKIIETLNWRYATKKFDTQKKVSDADIATIQEAFRLTASAYGLQAWKLFVVKKQDLKEKLQPVSYNQPQVVESSHVLVFARNNKSSEILTNEYLQDIADQKNIDVVHLDGFKQMLDGTFARLDTAAKNNWLDKQLYIALGNLLMVLATMKIDSCAMEGIVPTEYDKILELDEKGFATVLALPIGYRSAEDEAAQNKKIRFPLEKVTEIL